MNERIQELNDGQAAAHGDKTVGVKPAMSFDDWKEMGPLGSSVSVGDAAFGDFDYREDIRAGEGDKRAHVSISFTHPLANPKRERTFSDHEAAHSLWNHYRRTLTARDSKAAALMGALARTDGQMRREAAELAGRPIDSYRETRDRLADLDSTAKNADELAEEETSMRAQQARGAEGGEDYVVVAPSEAEAKVVRAMMGWAGQAMRGVRAREGGVLSPDKLPAVEEIERGLETAKPPMFDAERESGKRTVGVLASLGAENAAAGFISKMNRSLAVAPGKNGKLWKRLIDDKDPHFRVTVGFEKGNFTKKSVIADNEKVLDASDQVVAFWSGDDTDPVLNGIAQAARRGTLHGVFNEKGEELDRDLVGKHAMELNPSKIEWARSKSRGAFDLAAASPEGRLGLSLIRRMPRAAVNALGQTPLTLNELTDMAASEDGKRTLYQDHKISGQALQLLADDKAVADARESLQRILGHCRDHDVAVVGPEAYPENLLKGADKMSPVLFVQAKDPARMAEFRNATAILGDQELLAPMADRAGKTAAAMDEQGVALVQIEGQGMPAFAPASKPSMLVLPHGHGFVDRHTALNWQETDGVWNAEGAGTAWTIARDAEKGALALSRADAEDPVATVNLNHEAYKKLPAEQAEQIARGRLQDRAQREDEKIVRAPVLEMRKRIVENGGFVVSALPPVETSSVYSKAAQGRVGLSSQPTDETRAQAAEFAARTADAVVITQAATRSPMHRGLAVAAEKGSAIAALQPEKHYVNLEEVGGNLTLTQSTGREIANTLNVSGVHARPFEEKYANKRIAHPVHAGKEAEFAKKAAQRAEKADGKVRRKAADAAEL